ncbi:AAA domain-containing protein [Arthrobacter sp. ok909]|uniref:AAA family ATPase n=1 Tax=Arthrobacter sp. ok909 TaxID=1761746 RepID=UPI00088BDD79|nr:AAA family ATPase [Arthrobacter sp. ok909]SDP74086.1 AAA domain-containing protein [Arthrobacter sp. ok909]
MTETVEAVQPSWAPIDLTSVLDGTYKVQPPTFMLRTDSAALLYPAKVHSVHGESESGKSMLMHAVTAQELQAQRDVLFIDFESDQGTVGNRLLMLGASADNIQNHLSYVRPDCSPFGMMEELASWHSMLARRFSLAVIDGVTEAFTVFGVKSIDNDEVSSWGRMVPRQIAERTGAAVVVIDHVTKDSEGRGRFAIGAQAKMSYLTGASYSVEVIQPLGVGMAGKLAIRIGKDRPGLVRPHGGAWRKSDRTQEVAVALIDSTDRKTIRYVLVPPGEVAESPKVVRHEELMLNISQAVIDSPTAPSFRNLDSIVRGKQEDKRAAITELVNTGYLVTSNGPRNATLHHSVKPYATDTHELKKAV